MDKESWIRKPHARELVISCADGRIQSELFTWLDTFDVHPDLLLLPGAAWAINNDAVWQHQRGHIDALVRAHRLQSIWIVNHVDCARYRGLTFPSEQDEVDFHISQCREAMKRMQQEWLGLEINGRVLGHYGWHDIAACPAIALSL